MTINDTVRELSEMLAKKSIRGNFLSKQTELSATIDKLSQRAVETDLVSNISPNAGDFRGGRFLALSAGDEPTDADATGAFMSAEGETFGADTYNIGGVDLGVLQFGLSSETGKAIAGAGEVTLDVDGITFILPVPAVTDAASIKWKTGVVTPTSIASWADIADSTTNISVMSQGIAAYPAGDVILAATDFTGAHQATMYLEGNASQSYIGMFADAISISGPTEVIGDVTAYRVGSAIQRLAITGNVSSSGVASGRPGLHAFSSDDNKKIVVLRNSFVVTGNTPGGYGGFYFEEGDEGAETILLNITSAGSIQLKAGANIITDTVTGMKIGTATTQKIAFYNSTPISKPTVTGAKGGNAALTSLCTQLAALGLIVNSTT